MLLLVLILVLIAFGLLVVALLTGSVLWAWVSVGVSVAAAAVLLVDWMQRRSAVRAGRRGRADDRRRHRALPHRSCRAGSPVAEPATAIIPAVRATDGPRRSRAPARRSSRPTNGRRAVRRVRDRRPALAGAPSGSAGRPSERSPAALGPASSAPIGHTSVTNHPTGNRPARRRCAGDERTGPRRRGGDPDAEADTVDGRRREPRRSPTSRRGAGPTGRRARRAVRPPVGRPRRWPDVRTPLRSTGGHAGAAVRPGAGPRRRSARTASRPRSRATPTRAALVARLDDEVVVVDEQPRYHLAAAARSPGSR